MNLPARSTRRRCLQSLPARVRAWLLVLSAIWPAAAAWSADPVYRCGAASSPVYSQKPCADGKVVDVNDPRSPQQKAESQAAARMQAKTADRMEKDRLAQEAAWAKANKPVQVKAPRAKASAAKASRSKSEGKPKQTEKEPAYLPFTPKPKP